MSLDGARVEVVRALFAAFRAQDAATASALLADDFDFVSPQDAHLDKASLLEVCFPTADHFASFELLEVLDGEPVFVRYEYTLADGTRYRNVEAITVRDGLVHATEVYFGGEL